MRSAEDICFGVEVEGLLVNSEGHFAPAENSLAGSITPLDPEVELLFDRTNPEVEVRNTIKDNHLLRQREDITQRLRELKTAASHKQRSISFDSRNKETYALNTIGTHVHLDLSGFSEIMQQDPQFLTKVVGEFIRYYLPTITNRYCYSKRIQTRVKWVMEKIDFDFYGQDSDILENEFIPYFEKRDHVKLIKHRPEKGSLEICLPDSFDFSTEPDVYEALVKDLRNALWDCVKSYLNDEINLMSDQELKQCLGSVL